MTKLVMQPEDRVVRSFQERQLNGTLIKCGSKGIVRLNGDKCFAGTYAKACAFFDGAHHGALRAVGGACWARFTV